MRAGIYTARSGEQDFGYLNAMVAAGDARLLGERYDGRGRKHIVVEVAGRGGKYQANPAIRIGREFFSAAIKDYADWREKWWREAIQNAVDAGADVIRCSVETIENGADSFNVVVCDDNGSGMSEEVLLDKFLVLGATTKKAGTTTGGFGKAKELLLLPWISWKVETGNVVVGGQGADYEVSYIARARRGTRLTVHMPLDESTHVPACESFLGKCYLPRISFYVNRKPRRAALRKGEQVKEFSGKAAVYYDKRKSDYDRVIIRANGLYMFSEFISADVPGTIVVELLRPSVELLSANRDGFRDHELRWEMRKFADRLATDATQELKSKRGLIRKKFRGSGKFAAARTETLAAALLESLGPMVPRGGKGADRGLVLSSAQEKEIATVIETMAGAEQPEREFSEWGEGSTAAQPAPPINLRPSVELAKAMLEGTEVRGPTHMEAIAKQLAWEPDFFLYNNIEGWRVPKKFYPEKMAPTIRKLLRFWAELCRFALVGLGSEFQYGVGFVFDHNVHGMHVAEDGENWLLINPFVETRPSDRIFSLGKKGDVDQIWSTVVHEVTHMADGIDYHGDSYASALTRNFGLLRRTERPIERIRKACAARSKGPKKPKLPSKEKQLAALGALYSLSGPREKTIDQLNKLVVVPVGRIDGWDLNGLEARGWIDSRWDAGVELMRYSINEAGIKRLMKLQKAPTQRRTA